MPPHAIAFVWENFGPSHRDRIEAVAAAGFAVTGIEFNRVSRAYRWETGSAGSAHYLTLFENDEPPGQIALSWRLVRALLSAPARTVLLCHYNYPPVFVAALVLRLAGRRVVTMMDSKFDDYPRRLGREWLKSLLLAPYHGALVASRRSRDYLHFLGFVRRPVAPGFDTLDLARLRAAAEGARNLPHAERDFLIVARLVPKKNLGFALRAFARHRMQARHPRKLRIVGYGSELDALRNLAEQLGISDDVVFEGPLDTPAVAQLMREALCLILPSTEEQFGLVVIEALAQGLPVLVSGNAGAVDELIDNGVNGWIIDPWRPDALDAALGWIDRDETGWRAASIAASASSERGDVSQFVVGVRALLQTG